MVIVGEDDDAHVRVVRKRIEQRAVPCLVVDERRARVRLTYATGWPTVELAGQKGWTELRRARSIWWWRKETTLAFSRADDFGGDFVMRERRELLESFEPLLASSAWPIRPSVLRQASLKCHQLALAGQLGFRLPRTVVTNDASSVVRFARRHPGAFSDDRVLYKPLTWYVSPPHTFLYANVVTLAEIAAAAGSVAVAPCQFQEYVDKNHEVRVTLVGSRCFAVRIESQIHEQTQVDYRRAQHLNEYLPTDLPGEVVGRLHEFLRRSGLSYGAFDLIVTPEGDIVFLELNPVGQWLWLEERTGMDISGAVADLLVAGIDPSGDAAAR